MIRLATCLFALSITSIANAQSILFPQGTWTAQSYAGCVGGASETLISSNVGAGYCIFNNFALNIEGIGYGIIQNDPDTAAVGLQLIFRHHLIARDRWSIFADVGGGIFEAADDVPPGGTRFNFTLRTGLGLAYQLKPDLYLLAGLRYFHLSNAQIEGHERNPNINGVEGYVGLMFTFD